VNTQERLIFLMDYLNIGPTELARKTGKPVDRWKAIRINKVRASTEELDECVKLWPEYAYWITTGNTIPQAGQISPEMEDTRQKLLKVG